MTEKYYIGQIFEEMYPPEAANWVNDNNCVIDEIEPENEIRRFKIVEITPPTSEEIQQELDRLILTPSDVERALLKAKGWDFEDLKAFLKRKGYTDLQIKAIGVELRANNFFRGATIGEEPNKVRIVDAIGNLLGYSSEDMNYLFIHKELPPQGDNN